MCFSPSTVVIGGGLGRQEEFFGPLRELVLRPGARHPDDLTIVRSALGDDAGLSGAAGWQAAIRIA
jgi:predicted NBD/HSP70 family sugar kinase